MHVPVRGRIASTRSKPGTTTIARSIPRSTQWTTSTPPARWPAARSAVVACRSNLKPAIPISYEWLKLATRTNRTHLNGGVRLYTTSRKTRSSGSGNSRYPGRGAGSKVMPAVLSNTSVRCRMVAIPFRRRRVCLLRQRRTTVHSRHRSVPEFTDSASPQLARDRLSSVKAADVRSK